jgi:hypothetical protein
LGILSGAIDKLLITPATSGFDIEIIDFKTNRLSRTLSAAESASSSSLGPRASRPQSAESDTSVDVTAEERARRPRSQYQRSQNGVEQFAFDFNAPRPSENVVNELSLEDRVRSAAMDYQLQMQAYALAVRELAPALPDDSAIISTLHFLEPNVEFHLTADSLAPDACRRAIDDAMMKIVSSWEPGEFPVHTAAHCRMCNFLSICSAGLEYVRSMRQTSGGVVNSKAVEAGR